MDRLDRESKLCAVDGGVRKSQGKGIGKQAAAAAHAARQTSRFPLMMAHILIAWALF